jgi:uncharacterized protein (DUF697 family)
VKFDFRLFVRDAVLTGKHYTNVLEFTRAHRLWQGITSYRWLSKLLILAGVLLGLKFLSVCINWWQQNENGGLSLAGITGFFGSVLSEGYELFVIGGFKYVILILLEVVIFHFSRRTLEVLSGEEVESSFDAFAKAQIRMIGVSVYSFIMESIFSIIAGIALGILGMSFIKALVIWFIQCYFLGFAIVDNYNEIYGMTLKQSARYTWNYAGVALSTGVIVYILMIVPVIGTILGPLTGAVAATITMYQLGEKDQKLALAFDEDP